MPDALRQTPLHDLHLRLGARIAPFAGWALPLQFRGTLAEHAHTRTAASLFDVSHMGQITLHGPAAAASLETLVPADIRACPPGRQRYTLLLDDQGGILDDLMVANHGDRLGLVVNAACTEADLAMLLERLPETDPQRQPDQALLALQGPSAAATLSALCPEAANLPFMGVAELPVAGIPAWLSRSGYTGEDGYEISVASAEAVALAEALLAFPEVAPAGLAARDTLRLEAALCLYGADIDRQTSPIDAGLAWTIPKSRRDAADFPGAAHILQQLTAGPAQKRVGIQPEGRILARAETPILAADGSPAGKITSGGFSPTLGAPIAMGYVRADLAAPGTALQLLIRGMHHQARVVPMPFVPHRYAR